MTTPPPVHALITGGASGLGLATAQLIIHQGGKVAMLDINEQAGQQAVKQLGDNALFIETDVTHESQVDAAVEETVNQFGYINLAVNCAGIAPSQRVLGKEALMATEDFARAVTINLTSTFSVCRAAANAMQHNTPQQDDERGVIINTASIAAFDGQIGQAAYAASKGGVASMTLPLAREFARFGIRVVTIAPGLFKTPLFDKLPEKAINALTESIPFPKRIGRPEEFADLVLHIYNNRMFNGEVIRLDGALRM
ncbi:MAG: SDR family NAD(P)-dependent oxidoreductase [Gammaproteobacteria bacterium]|jgi:NAD(P)-dependent dehydrogenase (short-subunit alcohol dehydrogenase family)